MKRIGLLVALVAVTSSPVARAERGPVDWSGTVVGAVQHATGSTDLDDESYLTGGTLFTEGTARGESWSAFLQSEIQVPDVSGGQDFPREHVLRQAYVDVYGDDWDLRLGRQIIIWGRADRINPTDVITPRDFRFFSTEFQGQRYGAGAASGRYYLGPAWSLFGAVLPVFERTILPDGFLPPDTPAPPEDRPDVDLLDPQVAIKLERVGAGFDFSLSGYRGYSLEPATGVAGGTPLQLHPEFLMAGADFSATRGEWGFRGEMAVVDYREPERFAPGTGPEDHFSAVVGVERRLGNDDSVLFQLTWQRLFGHTDAADLAPGLQVLARSNDAVFGQFRRDRVGATLTLAGQRLNDNLRLEVAAAVHFDDWDWALRPRIEWSVTDEWTLAAVADLFGGGSDTRFGVLRDSSRVFFQIKRTLWSKP